MVLDDARLRKMILETAQMLCTVINLDAGEQVTPYKNSHEHGRLVKWATGACNWDWLWELGREMSKEYDHRFDKLHASAEVILSLEGYYKTRGEYDWVYPLSWCNAAGSQKHGLDFTHLRNVHQAYKLYLSARWCKEFSEPRPSGRVIPPTWTKRRFPTWL